MYSVHNTLKKMEKGHLREDVMLDLIIKNQPFLNVFEGTLGPLK